MKLFISPVKKIWFFLAFENDIDNLMNNDFRAACTYTAKKLKSAMKSKKSTALKTSTVTKNNTNNTDLEIDKICGSRDSSPSFNDRSPSPTGILNK